MKRAAVLLALLTVGAGSARLRPSEVHISFAGVIAQVLDPAHPARAVTLRGDGHMAHHATLFVRASQIISSDVAMSCDNDGTCAISLDGLRVSFAHVTGRPTFGIGGSFDRLVPHLRAITGGMTLSEAVHADAPQGPIGAIVDLPHGVYSATPYETRATFVPDHEQRGPRSIAREVFLTTRIASPELLFSNGKSIHFVDDEMLELRITNEPVHAGGDDHFALHYGLAAQPIERPLLMSAGEGGGAGLRISCSNTTYP